MRCAYALPSQVAQCDAMGNACATRARTHRMRWACALPRFFALAGSSRIRTSPRSPAGTCAVWLQRAAIGKPYSTWARTVRDSLSCKLGGWYVGGWKVGGRSGGHARPLLRTLPGGSRQRDFYFAGIPSPPLLKDLLKGE